MRTSYIKIFIIFIFSFFAGNLFSQKVENDGARYAANSVLSTGNWYKIKTNRKSFYKLSYEDLKKMGLSDPSKVKIYGYGGNLLDSDFSKPYVDDLPELPIWMEKGGDDVFGSGDYIIFYAQGMVKWIYEKSDGKFVHENNPYSTDAFFFVTEGSDGKKIETSTANATEYHQTLDWFDDYTIHEKDEKNLIESGREFYGESFRISNSQNFIFNTPGILEGKTATINFISKAKSETPLNVLINGVQTLSGDMPPTINRYAAAMELTLSGVWSGTVSEQNTVNVNYSGVNIDNTYLNYITLQYKRQLQAYEGVTFFRNISSINVPTQYKILNTNPGQLVFNVTNELNPQNIEVVQSGGSAQFIYNSKVLEEFAIVDLTKQIPTPEIIGKIDNQDLHALARADMVIIVQPSFEHFANQLAQIHFDDSGLTSIVVNPEKIYNEFSSGKPDATAYRRFLKMFYDRAENEEQKPRYLLLFGDGVYDNRFIESGKWSNVNKSAFLLTYQSAQSLSQISSYVTDDYFGFLDDSEGINLAKDKLDIGIGRFTVRKADEARGIINKIDKYINDKDQSIWKNNLLFLADDAIAAGNSPYSEMIHVTDTDKLAEGVNKDKPQFVVNKLYMDAFERVETGEGGRYPDAQKKLFESIEKGQLVLNYMGHGSTRDWSHEYILKYPDIENMTNKRLPVWITATCDFSRFDGEDMSGGEMALINPRGGAIGLFSTVRLVYASSNMLLATGLFNNIFSKENGKPLRLGDIMKLAKREASLSHDSNKLNFMLLGDPAMRLSYPDEYPKVEVTEINSIEGDELNGSPIVFNALSTVRIKGKIAYRDGSIDSDFNGYIDSKIFDSRQQLTTRDNANAGLPFTYLDYTNTIYNGMAEVKNGEFDYTFVVPKDILYSMEDYGKMSFYAYQPEGEKTAHGYFSNYKIYGTDPNATNDVTPPEITKLYLNNENFVSGDKTNNTPMLIAEVSDDTGINLSGWHGHEITITIEGISKNYLKTYNVTGNFQNIANSAKSGLISFLIPELENGKYKLTFRVWDVSNNSSTKEVEFVVTDEFQPIINEFFIYGNPAKDLTRFVLTTNLPGSELTVTFNVYNMAGTLVWSHQEKSASGNNVKEIEYEWNLLSREGSRLQPGIYLVRASVTSANGIFENAKGKKLIITKQ